jgi:hypothetical protein
MKILKNITVFTLVMLLTVSTVLEARETVSSKSSSSKFVDSSGTFDGNKIYADVTNNGLFLDYHVSGDSALEWPQGTGAHSIFQSALWMGATVNGGIRTIVGDYTQDMGPGPWGGDPLSAVHRIYKVEKAMLASPLDFADFQEWPVDFGAPWVDVDGDGSYNPLPLGTDHPEFIGDQVLWFVSNDGDPAYKLNFQTSPLDVEIQTTMFGFDRPDVFGDMVFLKQLVINKGENTLVDTYMGLWSDPDLGNASDDYVGCDVSLGMGYVWNEGADSTYDNLDVGTPAAGYDFFQGPMVPCETDGAGNVTESEETCPAIGAKMFGTRHPKMKNLKMSSFAFYINGDPTYTDPADENEGYNYLKGLRKDGSKYPVEIAGDLYDQKFCFYGDPNDSAGHSTANPVDGNYSVAADRRFLMSVGPFTMAPKDSQEVVFGIFHAAGGDALSSVAYLKEVDALAQTAYDIDFALPDSPPAPNVTASAFTDQIILTWDSVAESYAATSEVDLDASGNPTTFNFEGYNVYQYETATGAGNKKRLATYDLVNGTTEIYDTVFNAELGENINIRTQFGSDSGLSKFHVINADGLNGNSKLVTNRAYYYAVTAYGYNPGGIPKTLESNPVYLTVRPEVSNTLETGENTATIGQKIAASHVGPSGGSVNAVIVDPSQLVEGDYTVSFNDEYTYLDANGDEQTEKISNWTLTDSNGNVLVDSNPVVGGINGVTGVEVGPNSVPVINGMQIEVNGPQLSTITDINEWDAGWKENAVLRDPAVSAFVPWASLGSTGYILENRAGEINVGGYARDFDRFDYWEADDVELDFSETSVAWTYSGSTVSGTLPFALYRHNFGTGVKERIAPAWWDHDGTGDFDLSLMIDCLDDDGNVILDDDGNPEQCPTLAGPVYGRRTWDPIYGYMAFDLDGDGVNEYYDTAKEAQYIADNNAFASGFCGWGGWANGGCPGATTSMTNTQTTYIFMTATMFTDYLGNGVLPDAAGIATGAYQAVNFTGASSVVFQTAKPNSSKDTFSFSTTGLGMLAKEYDPDSITVWPNPYYGYNPEERDALDRRVMFSHLPTEGPTTIRIFALDGTLVRTIKHNDVGSQHTYWDMKNNFELPVASGMYVAHVETNKGDKILKLAVIQPEQRLDVY